MTLYIMDMVSEKCKLILSQPPPCRDSKKMRQWVMCYARKLIEEGYDYSRSMKIAWSELRRKCSL